ncbi:unnamed protein product [Mytilus edulis]|uniref:Uncharacterized protein n=1 Tax=Mytilus edulis TaxID=6550 RepID=A0A8S3V711_MYTED|nr:unnamed protein product [Mytilus edulis]
MMMTLSISESKDTAKQSTRLDESEIDLQSRQVTINSSNVKVISLENVAENKVHEKRILESHPRGSSEIPFTTALGMKVMNDPNSKQCAPLDRTSKTKVVNTESNHIDSCVAATNISGLFHEESRRSNVMNVVELENGPSVFLPKESSTSEFLSEEYIPSDVQPKQTRSSDLIYEEMASPVADEAKYIVSTDMDSVARIRMPGILSLEQKLQESQTSNDSFDPTIELESSTAIYPQKRNDNNKPVRENSEKS